MGDNFLSKTLKIKLIPKFQPRQIRKYLMSTKSTGGRPERLCTLPGHTRSRDSPGLEDLEDGWQGTGGRWFGLMNAIYTLGIPEVRYGFQGLQIRSGKKTVLFWPSNSHCWGLWCEDASWMGTKGHWWFLSIPEGREGEWTLSGTVNKCSKVVSMTTGWLWP